MERRTISREENPFFEDSLVEVQNSAQFTRFHTGPAHQTLMSIHRKLLLFFLLMGLVPAVAITGLAFFQARDALKLEIIRNLKTQATALMEQIDRMVYERMLHVHTWSELEIMQEVRVGDVDKRLSHLLFDLHRQYNGVYKALYCSNRKREVVAASDPGLIGRRLGEQPVWLTTPLVYGQTRLSPLLLRPELGEADIYMEATIHDPEHKDDEHEHNVGNLHVLFDWAEIFRLLDRSGQGQEAARPLALLFDAQGRVIAASAALRERGLLLSTALAEWREKSGRDAVIADQERRLGFGEVLAGSSTAQGYQSFPGFGWTVQVYQPTAQAFAPIDRMAVAFFLLLGITCAAAMALSLLIARGIARPIVELTNLTRDFMGKGKPADPIHLGKGEVGELAASFLSMIRDLEKSRDNLVRAAKLAVVGEMAATMAHEVRTPLGIMRSSAQMLQREPGLSETGKEMLEFILSEDERLNKLISSLLDCANPRPPNIDHLHLHAIALRAMDLLSLQAQSKNIHLAAELNAPDDLLAWDEEQMLQVLLNLVMNALQILPPGGEITLRSFATKAGLVLNVDDNGPGIQENDRPKVFDPFFTQRAGGIGLGLTVVQQIIRAHGATITAAASPAGGARFQLVFPQITSPRQDRT
jgi:signal transduction histidine kinase